MAYSKELVERIRKSLLGIEPIYERSMFGGRCFMLNGKMLVCAGKDRFLFRVGPEQYDDAFELPGVSPMVHNGRMMKGFVFVEQDSVATDDALDHWLKICVEFNDTLIEAENKKQAP